MKKPIIGITLDNEEPGSYSKFPWYAIRYNYLHSIEKFGAIPFPLYHTEKNINELFGLLDGLIITGNPVFSIISVQYCSMTRAGQKGSSCYLGQ